MSRAQVKKPDMSLTPSMIHKFDRKWLMSYRLIGLSARFFRSHFPLMDLRALVDAPIELNQFRWMVRL